MTIRIDNPEIETLLEEIRALSGRELDEILLALAREEAEKLRRSRPGDVEGRRARLEAISRRAAAKIPEDAPTPEEIIGYDENGLPR